MVGGDPTELPPLTVEEVNGWYERLVLDPYSWSIEYDGRCIGTARLHDFDLASRAAWYAIGIFDAGVWNRGLGTEATRLILNFAFDQLRLRDVFLRVLDYNQRAIAAYKKCGFVVERVERNLLTTGDERRSDFIMRITAPG